MTLFTNRVCRIALIAFLALIGRSTLADFSTVINVPPEAPPRRILSDTQLNVLDGGRLPSTYSSPFLAGDPRGEVSNLEINVDGGEVGDWFHANTGSTVNITGGSVGYGFQANDGSQINISGGIVDRGFEAYSGSDVTISGGAIGRSFGVESGSQVTLVGGDFSLNGSPLTDSKVTLSGMNVLSGTFADGSPLILSPLLGDNLSDVTLTNVTVPPIDLTPIVVDSEIAPRGLRAGQTLTLEEGGVLPEHFVAVNATLNIHGGYINGLAAIGSQVNIGGGDIVGLDTFEAFYGTHVVFCGGSTRSGFAANDGSQVTVVSGVINPNFDANQGSKVTFTGGTLDGSLYAYSGSEITLIGTEFSLDGQSIAALHTPGDSLDLESRDWKVLSGTLSDGSPFEFDTTLFYSSGRNFFHEAALLRLTLAIPGDYNNNGQVEQGDLDLVLTNWGHNMAAVPSGWIASAPNGPIDQQELDAVLLNWGSGAPLGAGGVPEPGTLILLMVAIGVSCFATRLPRTKGRTPSP